MSAIIVVLSYNHPELTARTMTSVLQTGWPVLLVHNGSEARHREALESQFPQAQHLVLPTNRGYAGGVNAGFDAAFARGADWVLLVTNDCVLTQWQLPEGGPAIKAPLVYRRKLSNVDSLAAAFEPGRAHLYHLKSRAEFEALPLSPQKIAYVPGSIFWIHREVFERTGRFDETLVIYWDDVDYCVRAQRLGFAIQVDERTAALHGVSKTTSKDPLSTTFLFQRNRRWVSRRYCEGRLNRWMLNLRLERDWWQGMFRAVRRWDHPRLALWWRVREAPPPPTQ